VRTRPWSDVASTDTGSRLPESGRVEAFSDGVLAIVITLLVLDLHPPEEHGKVLHDLLHQWPGYVAYLGSFAYAGVIWVNHHQLFTRIAVADVGLLWRNLALLLATSMLPFPTAVLAAAFQHGSQADKTTAVMLYCCLATVMACTWLAIFQYLCGHPRLLSSGTPVNFFVSERARSLLGIGFYVLAAVLSLWQPLVGLLLTTAMPLFYGLTSSGWSRAAAQTEPTSSRP
jgi:uncharacterized membrane protein